MTPALPAPAKWWSISFTGDPVEKTDHELLLEIHQTVTELVPMIQTFRRVLFGNGDIGLVARVDALERLLNLLGSIARYAIIPAMLLFFGPVCALLWGIYTGQITLNFLR